jgi:hypothetical protein
MQCHLGLYFVADVQQVAFSVTWLLNPALPKPLRLLGRVWKRGGWRSLDSWWAEERIVEHGLPREDGPRL